MLLKFLNYTAQGGEIFQAFSTLFRLSSKETRETRKQGKEGWIWALLVARREKEQKLSSSQLQTRKEGKGGIVVKWNLDACWVKNWVDD